MATAMRHVLWGLMGELRFHPVRKWVRAKTADQLVVDSHDVMLVWEPRRVVGSYAVPAADIRGLLVPHRPDQADERPVHLEDGRPVLDPSTPFAAHSTPGATFTIRTETGDLPGAGFVPEDPDLHGYVILDWAAFTQWFEEDEEVLAHPHDPFDRIDCLRSSRHIQIRHQGTTLADTTRATLLFETPLPTRYYLPADDIAMDLLQPSPSHTLCAYKGRARYWSATVGEEMLPDIAWSYPEPLHDAEPVSDLIAFFTERLDLIVDGEPQPRPRTPWS